MSSTNKDLHEPLLGDGSSPKQHADADVQDQVAVLSAVTFFRLKFLFALTGSLIAYLGQIALCILLWRDDIYQRTRQQVLIFSLFWSFWTCVVFFVGLLALLRLVQKRLVVSPLSEPTLFWLEAFYVAGAQLTITATWLSKDLLQQGPVVLMSHPVTTTLALLIPGYLWLARALLWKNPLPAEQQAVNLKNNDLPSNDNNSALYCWISACLGLAVGVGSQFILGMLLWKDHSMTEPVIHSVIYFSLFWSLCTVVMTFMACLSLRFLLPTDNNEIANTTEGDASTLLARLLLRMEATYISCTLVGICGAWMVIDCMIGLTDQVLPSMVMLGLSLLCFHLILRCFPEETCVVAEEAAQDPSSTMILSESSKSSEFAQMLLIV